MENTEGGVWEGWNFGNFYVAIFAKEKSKIASFSVQPFMVKFEFEIYNCEFCSFLLFLQGEFQEKLNKLESESENEGRGWHFGKFSYWHFSKEESA